MGKTKIESFACYDEKIISSYLKAKGFAGNNGRIATAIDIVDARIDCSFDSYEWDNYFVTMSAEYVGVGSDGKFKLIVAHGVGPLATIDGIKKAYSYQSDSLHRKIEGGRVTREEFLKLENGYYGDVYIIDFEDYLEKTESPFSRRLKEGTEFNDLVLIARLGPRYKEYLDKAKSITKNWKNYKISSSNYYYHNKYSNEFIGLKLNSVLYQYENRRRDLDSNLAFANLLTFEGLTSYSEDNTNYLTHSIDLQSWYEGARFVGINNNVKISSIISDFYYNKSISDLTSRKHLMVEEDISVKNMLTPIIEINDNFYTQVPKIGKSIDTLIPKFIILSLYKVGDIVEIKLSNSTNRDSLIYDIKDVEKFAPKNANTYFLYDSIRNNEKVDSIKVQFYEALIYDSKRLLSEEEVYNDFNIIKKVKSIL